MGGENLCSKAFPAPLFIGVGDLGLIRTSADSTFLFDLLKSTMTPIRYIQRVGLMISFNEVTCTRDVEKTNRR
jgi:hypothetical protein